MHDVSAYAFFWCYLLKYAVAKYIYKFYKFYKILIGFNIIDTIFKKRNFPYSYKINLNDKSQEAIKEAVVGEQKLKVAMWKNKYR